MLSIIKVIFLLVKKSILDDLKKLHDLQKAMQKCKSLLGWEVLLVNLRTI